MQAPLLYQPSPGDALTATVTLSRNQWETLWCLLYGIDSGDMTVTNYADTEAAHVALKDMTPAVLRQTPPWAGPNPGPNEPTPARTGYTKVWVDDDQDARTELLTACKPLLPPRVVAELDALLPVWQGDGKGVWDIHQYADGTISLCWTPQPAVFGSTWFHYHVPAPGSSHGSLVVQK